MRTRQIELDDEEELPEVGEIVEFHVDPEAAGARLDHFLSERMPGRSRSQIQAWIEDGLVMVAGGGVKPSYKVRAGQDVCVEIPPLEPAEPEPDRNIPLDILYEDKDVLVLNKQRGLVIHPATTTRAGTLVNALLHHCRDLSGIRGVEKPGIVHRLDKDTSGVMVVAKSDAAHLNLSIQFRDRAVLKVYEALVHGVPCPVRGRISLPIGRHNVERKRMSINPKGKTAITDWEVLEDFGPERRAESATTQGFSRLELHIHTGRTHQIRVHMTHLGHPLVGDVVYGRRPNPFGLVGQALHCRRLGFVHPITQQPLEFTAEPPEVYEAILRELRTTRRG